MKPECIINNVVIVYDRRIYDYFETSLIKEKLELSYSDKELGIGSSELNDFKAVFSSQSIQIQVIAQNTNLIIAENKINKTEEVDTDFIKAVSNIEKSFREQNLTPKQYGFNYSFAYEETDSLAVAKAIKDKFFNPEAVGEVNENQFYLPNYCKMLGDIKYAYRFDMEPNEQSEFKRIIVNANVHLNSEIPSDAIKLSEICQGTYKEVISNLEF